MSFTILSQEVKEMIFSYLEYSDLERFRCWQSKSFKRKTRYRTFLKAADHGNLSNMRWFLSNGYKIELNTFSGAAYYGGTFAMQFLLDSNFILDKYAFIGAVLSGDISTLQWLYDNKCP